MNSKSIVNFVKRTGPLIPENQATTFAETEYFFENNLRKVKPYFFTHHSFCKKRWIGQTPLQVLAKEYTIYGKNQIDDMVGMGRFMVNMKPLTMEQMNTYKIKDGDLFSSKVHRHEPPIAASKPEVIFEDDKFYVIDKPSSFPIHPVTQYRHNSLIFILAREMDANHHVVHRNWIVKFLSFIFREVRFISRLRLDRLTSGLMILAKTKEQSQILSRQISSRELNKEYVCLTMGHFPDTLVIDKPLLIVDHAKGLVQVDARGKEAKTAFERIRYDEKQDVSIVRARPETGRTHQIRVHLQYAGHPIVNDMLYNHPAFGQERFEPMVQKELDLDEFHKALAISRGWNEHGFKSAVKKDEEVKEEETHGEHDPLCPKCNERPADPVAEDLILYLHCLCYTGPDWTFKSDMPEWTVPDYTIPAFYDQYRADNQK